MCKFFTLNESTSIIHTKMFRKRMLKIIQRSYNTANYFGSCPIRLDVNSHHFYIDNKVIPKCNRNFVLAQIWNILAFVLILKHYHNHTNLDDFHLTLSWWLGYGIYILGLTISRYFSVEFANTGNGLLNLLDGIYGNS